jgi:hypothetical protein
MSPVATALVLAAIAAVGVLSTHELKGVIVSAAQDVVDQVTAQVLKAKEEVLAKIAELEAAAAAGEVLDFTALKDAVQSVDDIVPDAPVEPPVEETPAV